MSQVAYFDTQYSDWIVRDPIITVCAYDMYTGDPVYAGVYLNGNYVGTTFISFEVPPNNNLIGVDWTGYDWFYMLPESFVTFDL